MDARGRRRVVVAPDKFRGSLTAAEVAHHLGVGLRTGRPGVEVVEVPVADGGEGTVDAALAAGFTRRTARVAGPLGDPVEAAYALGDGAGLGFAGVPTAVVELALASGLERLPRSASRSPTTDALRASSRGTGDLVRAALDAGAQVVVLGLGGSACTDGGAGLLAALGARFTDDAGRPLPDGGGALVDLVHVDLSGLDPRAVQARFLLASDVDHPLLGPRGAAAVFAPQKGADPAQVARLERALSRWVDVLAGILPDARAAAGHPGAGAAGGVGFGALAVLGARREPGIDLVLRLVDLASRVAGADLVLTGEGSLDEQSLGGKAPLGVARLACRHGVEVRAVCGRTTLIAVQAEAAGFAAVHALTDLEPDPARCMAEAGPLLEDLGRRLAEGL